MKRRDFLRTGLAAGALAGLGGLAPRPAAGHYYPPQDKLRILVLGGTAFLGPAVVSAARRRGHTLTLFNRGRTNPDLFQDIEQIHGDRNEDLQLLEGRQWDCVVDTSGFFPRQLEASAGLLKDQVGHYLYISSISVYDSFEKKGIDESHPVGTTDEPDAQEITETNYGPLKALCEQAVEEAMPGRATHIRPGLIVGPRDRSDRFTYWPVRVKRGGEILAPHDPEQGIQVMDVNDLGRWIVHCLEEEITGTYNATSPAGWLTMGGLLRTCQAVTGSDATFTWVPWDFLEEHEVQAWSELPCWVPPQGEWSGMNSVDVSAAVQKGLFFRPISETVRETLDWWSCVPAERKDQPPRAGLDPQKEQAVLTAWHEKQSGQG